MQMVSLFQNKIINACQPLLLTQTDNDSGASDQENELVSSMTKFQVKNTILIKLTKLKTMNTSKTVKTLKILGKEKTVRSSLWLLTIQDIMTFPLRSLLGKRLTKYYADIFAKKNHPQRLCWAVLYISTRI